MSLGRVVALWLQRLLMLPAALIGFMFTLWLASLPSLLLYGGSPCLSSGRLCWGQMFGQAAAYTVGAIVFVMVPVLLEPKEKFSVAVIFYGVGAAVVVFGVTAIGFWGMLWLIAFPPLIAGLGYVYLVKRRWGYGSAARFFSASPKKIVLACKDAAASFDCPADSRKCVCFGETGVHHRRCALCVMSARFLL